MRKKLLLILALVLLLTGCGRAKQQQPLPEPTEETEAFTEAETEPETEAPTLHVTERITALEAMNGTAFVLDEHGHLTEEQAAQYREALQALSDSSGICTALVITDTLAGFAPDRFAQKYYTALFGENTDGFLLLINNDTGEDLYYQAGSLTIQNTDMRLAQASKYLVNKDFPAAIGCLLPTEDELILLPPEEEIEEQSAD